MIKVIALCLATFATFHQVSAADGENQKTVVEVKPVFEPEISHALRDLIPMAMDVLRRNESSHAWLTSSVTRGQWSTFTYQNGHFGIRVFTEAEKEQLRDSIPQDLRASDMFQVKEVQPSFIRIKSKELELTIPATRISFIARGIRGDLPR